MLGSGCSSAELTFCSEGDFVGAPLNDARLHTVSGGDYLIQKAIDWSISPFRILVSSIMPGDY